MEAQKNQCLLVLNLYMQPRISLALLFVVVKNRSVFSVTTLTECDQNSTEKKAFLRYFISKLILYLGLGLDPIALRKLSAMVFRLAFSPCLAETVIVAVVSHLLLGFPWQWGFMLGFILAAVSPAVVVPCLLSLQVRDSSCLDI